MAKRACGVGKILEKVARGEELTLEEQEKLDRKNERTAKFWTYSMKLEPYHYLRSFKTDGSMAFFK